MKTVEIKFEKVKVKAGKRKLKDTWKIEIDPEPVVMYYYPTLWERICDWFSRIFLRKKSKYTIDKELAELMKYEIK